MDLKKNRSYIDRCLVELNNCNDLDKFYELCTGLYYRINATVFYFEDKLLKAEEKNVSDNRTNID